MPENTDGQPLHDLTGFQRDLLTVIDRLSDRPQIERKGLAIKDEIEEFYGSVINHGRLYPNLDALAKKSLVEKGHIDKRTNYYSLTARGERELALDLEWREAGRAEA